MEQSIEEIQAEFYKNIDTAPPPESPSLKRAIPDKQMRSDTEILKQQFEQAGVDTQGVADEITSEKNKARVDMLEKIHQDQQSNQRKQGRLDVAEGAVQAAAGVGVGLGTIVKNIHNGIMGVADLVENYAASKGVGSGDLINADSMYTSDMNASSLDQVGKVTKVATEFATPIIATIATGGGFVAGMVANAAYNFLAMDPKGGRFSDILHGTFVDEIPIASDAVEFLRSKPTDSEMMGRVKNFTEGLGFDVAIGMVVGASRVYSGIKALRDPKVLETMVKETKVATEAAESAASRVKNPAPVTPAETSALNVSDAAISSKETGAIPIEQPASAAAVESVPTAPAVDENYNLFEKEWATYFDHDSPGVRIDPATEKVSIRLGDDALPDYMGKIIQEPQMAAALQRSVPMTDTEMLQAARKLKNEPGILDRLVNAPPGTAPDATDTLVVRMILGGSHNEMGASAAKVLANPTKAGFATFGKDLENYIKIAQVSLGIGSVQGRAFRANQVLAQMAGMGDKEALQAIGDLGRSNLTAGILEKYGGIEKLQQMATDINLIREFADVAAIPNSRFAVKMKEIVRQSQWRPFERVVETFALNGMLSSPTTWKRAGISGGITNSITIATNYMEATISAGLGGGGKTFAEANASLLASMGGLFSAMKPAAKAIYSGKAPNNLVRAEIRAATNVAPSTLEDLAEKAGATWVERSGVVLDAISSHGAVQGPGRILMGIDNYWQHVAYTGVIESEAVRAAIKAKIPAADVPEFMKAFREKPSAAALKKAADTAGTNTFAKDLEGRAAAIQEGLAGLLDWAPFSRVILPFTKTGLNIAEYSIEHSVFAVFSSDFRQAAKQGGRAADEAYAKVAVGTTGIIGLVTLAHMGLIDGTDIQHGELDPTTIALRNNRTVPSGPRIKVGENEWTSLKGLEPLSGMVETASIISQLASRLPEEEYADMVTAFRMVVANTVSPENVVAGVSDLINLLDPNSDKTNYLAGMVTRFIPYGAALRDVTGMVDPIRRSTKADKGNDMNDFLEMVKAKAMAIIPGMSNDLPPDRNFYGEAMKLPNGVGPDAISPLAIVNDKDMPYKKAIEALQDFYTIHKDNMGDIHDLAISMPPRTIKNEMSGLQYPLSPKEYSSYMVAMSGRDPATGAVGRMGLMKERIQQILEDGGAMGKRATEFTREQHLALTGQISDVISAHRAYADAYIRSRQDVAAKMKDQADRKNAMPQGSM